MPFTKVPCVRDDAACGVWLQPSKLRHYGNVVQDLVAELNELSEYSDLLTGATRLATFLWKPPYYDDMKTVAEASDLSAADIVIANHAYEISRFGCTTRIDQHQGRLRLSRTLDWPLPLLGPCTVAVHHAKYDCTTVTFPGFVGALTGVRHGEYVAAINAAPPSGIVSGWQPLLLLRWVFENCDTYEEALDVLCDTALTTGVFFTLVGTDEACIIERTADDYEIRIYNDTPLFVANHYRHANFKHLNPKNPDSVARSKAFKADARAWRSAPVLNDSTVQYIQMTPVTGECKAWRMI